MHRYELSRQSRTAARTFCAIVSGLGRLLFFISPPFSRCLFGCSHGWYSGSSALGLRIASGISSLYFYWYSDAGIAPKRVHDLHTRGVLSRGWINKILVTYRRKAAVFAGAVRLPMVRDSCSSRSTAKIDEVKPMFDGAFLNYLQFFF